MRELSLFTGAGGGLLGTKLLGWTLAGCVEWDDYCQRVLRQRQEDGLIETAPIFSDIRAFISEGYARRYRGMVDVITAGFPCQAYSTAARGRNKKEKDMLPETIQAINIIRPRHILLENVSRKAIDSAEGKHGYWAIKPEKQPSQPKTWAQTILGVDTGYMATPTTMGNQCAPSMMKHAGCRRFKQVYGRVTPAIYEHMMGWPINWSALEPLGTGRSQQWLEQHGSYYHQAQ